MDDEVRKLVVDITKPAFFQGDRIRAALRLGEILEDENLTKIAQELKPISQAEANYVSQQALRQRDGQLWNVLNQALDAKGYPPATTLKDTMTAGSKANAEQLSRWFGEEAVVYSREIIETATSPLKGKCAEVLGMAGHAEDLPILIKILEDPISHNRVSAILGLSKMGLPEAWQAIIKHSEVENPSSQMMEAIAIVLGDYDDPSSVAVLKGLLENAVHIAEKAGLSLLKLGQRDIVVHVKENHEKKYFQDIAAQVLESEK